LARGVAVGVPVEAGKLSTSVWDGRVPWVRDLDADHLVARRDNDPRRSACPSSCSIDHHESLRTQGFRSYIDALAARGLLRDGLDPAEATDVLLTLAGSDVFLNFTEERG
jgi:hypothetical protein